MTDPFLAAFRAHVLGQPLFPERGRVLVAVSGGADSLALLELLHRVAETAAVTLAVGHVDHGIHPDSATWAASVRRRARMLDVPYVEQQLGLGRGTSETAARDARHAALRRMQREADARYLALGHHADDQVETVLLRALRGSGPAGLAGMAGQGPRGLVRPLLPFRRAALRAWLAAQVPGVTPVTDPANDDPAHDRGWIRTVLLPAVRERLPDVEGDLLHLAADAAAHRAAWSAVLSRLPGLGVRRAAGAIEVARAPLLGYDNVLSEAILRAVAREVGCTLGPRRAAALRAFLAASQSGRRFELGAGWVADVDFDTVRMHRAPVPVAEPGAVRWGGGARGEASWGEWCISWVREPAGVTRRGGTVTWVTEGEGMIRAFAAGDRLLPLGGRGRRKVRRLLMEARVPRAARRRYPVLERDGDILWIPGICRSAGALPRPGETALRVDAHRHGHP